MASVKYHDANMVVIYRLLINNLTSGPYAVASANDQQGQRTREGLMGVPIKISKGIHLISAFWTMALALLIFGDVMGRQLFGTPIPGTKEILQNSVVSIAFLQLPLAIYSGSMLRTSVLADAVPPFIRKIFRTFSALLGICVFVALVWSTSDSFADAYRIGEYEGEGSLRVPTWPVRGAVMVMSAFVVLAYIQMIILDWQNKLFNQLEAPGAIAPGQPD